MNTKNRYKIRDSKIRMKDTAWGFAERHSDHSNHQEFMKQKVGISQY